VTLQHNQTELYNLICFGLQVTPDFIPKAKGTGDTSNFDQFNDEPLATSHVELFPKEFADF